MQLVKNKKQTYRLKTSEKRPIICVSIACYQSISKISIKP